MAIGRISGAMLKANLERLGTDLAFETDLLYIDVANDRIGINTTTPSQSLQVDNVTINNSQIRSTSGKLDLGAVGDISITGGGSSQVLTTDGSGNLSFTSISGGGLVTGRDVTLSYPDDSSLYPTGAINDWTFSTNVSTAIDDLNEFMTELKKLNIKNIKLPVSAPFHCMLMSPATQIMNSKLKEIKFLAPNNKIVSNVTAQPSDNPENIKNLLIEQIEKPVRWRESIINIINQGNKKFIEIGPGKVLSGLVKRIDRNIELFQVNNIEDLNNLDTL